MGGTAKSFFKESVEAKVRMTLVHPTIYTRKVMTIEWCRYGLNATSSAGLRVGNYRTREMLPYDLSFKGLGARTFETHLHLNVYYHLKRVSTVL